jgi:dihydropteroate synthase
MSGGPYLRPLGFVWGDASAQACAAGAAIPVAGGPAACLGFELIEGTPGRATRKIVPAAQIAASAEPAFHLLLGRLSAARPPLAQLAPDRPRLMGIVNVTPDSFSDGGDFAGADAAIAQARRLAAEGADIVDIGGESTRPGAMAVDEAEELRRIVPVLEGLAGLPAAISVDTRKSAVMGAAIKAGASIINDVSALSHDPQALSVAAALRRLPRPTAR